MSVCFDLNVLYLWENTGVTRMLNCVNQVSNNTAISQMLFVSIQSASSVICIYMHITHAYLNNVLILVYSPIVIPWSSWRGHAFQREVDTYLPVKGQLCRQAEWKWTQAGNRTERWKKQRKNRVTWGETGGKRIMSRRSEQHQRTVSPAVIWPCIWFLLLLCFPYPTRYTLSVTSVALASACARWEQSRGLNSASVFRCTNGITEAKMAGGERWVHREQQTAPHHCCCCRSAKPLDCDGMGSVCVCVSVHAYVCMCENEGGRANEWEVFLYTDGYGRTFAINSFCSRAFIFC